MTPEDSSPVDIISPDQLAKVMAGMKTGKKENPKPLVEKVAEAKPVEDAVGKITEKAPVVTEAAPPPQPKVEEKPVEKKPDPPKAGRRRRKSRRRKSRSRSRKSRSRRRSIRSPKRSRRKRRSRRRSRCSRPPSRRSRRSRRSWNGTSTSRRSRPCSTSAIPRARRSTGETLNSNAALGLAKGTAADNSATWGAMFQRQVERCWKKPYGGIEIAEA